MTGRYDANRALAGITFFFIVGGIIAVFPLDQLWLGIAMLIFGLSIILLKVTWGIAVWADNITQRWSEKNLAPKDGFDVTFKIKEDKDETK